MLCSIEFRIIKLPWGKDAPSIQVLINKKDAVWISMTDIINYKFELDLVCKSMQRDLFGQYRCTHYFTERNYDDIVKKILGKLYEYSKSYLKYSFFIYKSFYKDNIRNFINQEISIDNIDID